MWTSELVCQKLGLSFGVLALLVATSSAATNGDQKLVNAARAQDWSTVQSLVKQRVDVNAPDPEGVSPLGWAAHWGNVETADLLIHAGAHVNTLSRYGLTPLSEAAARGDADMIELLLKAGADVKSQRLQRESPLITVAKTGNVEAIKALLDHGADPNAREPWRGQTALMLAAAEGHAAAVTMLLSRGANPNIRSTTFDLQDRDGIVGLQASLYWKGGLTALLFAARQGQIGAGRALVDGGADASLSDTDFGFTPLMEAIFNGHLDFAAMLVERGANINDGSLYLLIDQFRLIPKRDERQTVTGMIHLFLGRGADPNVSFNSGKIPPRMTFPAIRYGPVPAGSTPLFAAARNRNFPLMQMLLEKHADPNKTTTVDHQSPLMALLAGEGRRGAIDSDPKLVAAVQALVDGGADVNADNSRGLTAVHFAARGGNNEVLRFLVENGARLDLKDRLGRTPLDLANGVLTALTGDDGPPHPETVALIKHLMQDASRAHPPG